MCPTGPLADGLIEGGMPVARVRKIAQATAFLGPTACLTAAAICDDGPATVGKASTTLLMAKILGDMSASTTLIPAQKMLWPQSWLLPAVPRECPVYVGLMVPA